jgi:hypothetical protein
MTLVMCIGAPQSFEIEFMKMQDSFDSVCRVPSTTKGSNDNRALAFAWDRSVVQNGFQEKSGLCSLVTRRSVISSPQIAFAVGVVGKTSTG